MKIYTDTPEATTVVKNAFIDQHMPQANGEFVKVYLIPLRCANTGRDLSLSSIADALEHTDKDIQRALSYWGEAGSDPHQGNTWRCDPFDHVLGSAVRLGRA